MYISMVCVCWLIWSSFVIKEEAPNTKMMAAGYVRMVTYCKKSALGRAQ